MTEHKKNPPSNLGWVRFWLFVIKNTPLQTRAENFVVLKKNYLWNLQEGLCLIYKLKRNKRNFIFGNCVGVLFLWKAEKQKAFFVAATKDFFFSALWETAPLSISQKWFLFFSSIVPFLALLTCSFRDFSAVFKINNSWRFSCVSQSRKRQSWWFLEYFFFMVHQLLHVFIFHQLWNGCSSYVSYSKIWIRASRTFFSFIQWEILF